ncbi:FAD-dependent oxidoreductase [Crateriforma conspicua]|uniref:NAD-dependent dihydropyrimidine dehydrogenase subunit PreT n=1 Tax=Crateriforma conspicua TaxID=2527996 RepID=A0A5C5Y6N3_9PLAN|nr:FAD-dependent oxidoreductase [Crateriforma conspicua]QDV65224.1 NAD-dependent dihydropyrimidine dehydrogenase subunit PreT [Crateriforma conspicua]TWT70619.1 NAD-dependent dihydropyrimidine dehydrogenase subunit PreT [Crateriforma conspicua]
MPTIRIDQTDVVVDPGTTVLEAALSVGIEIPTLCYLKGYDPSASCQVCLVRDVATGRMVPSCATAATDGLQIESESDEVHAARRTALELLLSEHVGDCLAPCHFACPAHMDIPLMLRQIGDQEWSAAIETIKNDIAFPAILGRICTKPCEKGCRRNAADDPVAVCQLKQVVADKDLATGDGYQPEPTNASGKRVAVIGAGLTGLSAAYYLTRLGHQCQVLEKASQPGGRLHALGGDALPPAVLASEIQRVRQVGFELTCDRAVQSKDEFENLLEDFDAVLVAWGEDQMQAAQQWGLKTNRKGIQVDRATYATDVDQVFAAGNAVRGNALFVRSTADGKEAAVCIDQYLTKGKMTGISRAFSSRMGKVAPQELDQFVQDAGHAPLATAQLVVDESTGGVDSVTAAKQSGRCLACGCVAHGNCRLEHWASIYNADPGRFGSRQATYEVVGRGGDVLFEPGKCIKCELCIQIASKSKSDLGLSFVGRGFDVRVGVPFDRSWEDAVHSVARECVDACPTGAIYFRWRDVDVVDLGESKTESE